MASPASAICSQAAITAIATAGTSTGRGDGLPGGAVNDRPLPERSAEMDRDVDGLHRRGASTELDDHRVDADRDRLGGLRNPRHVRPSRPCPTPEADDVEGLLIDDSVAVQAQRLVEQPEGHQDQHDHEGEGDPPSTDAKPFMSESSVYREGHNMHPRYQ